MPLPRRSLVLSLALLSPFSISLFAQENGSTRDEFWPELDAFIKLNDQFRLFLLASRTKAEEFDYTEAMFGVHLDFGLKPRIRIAMRDLDATKMQYLSFRVGYRYNRSINDNENPFREHRPILELTPRYPLPARMLLSDRNRLDLRWVNSLFSWRYRNRLTLEREFHIGEKHALTPYTSGELYYDSRFEIWNRNRYAFGLQTTFSKRFMVDTYYMRQNDSRSEPHHVNAFGLVLNLFFR